MVCETSMLVIIGLATVKSFTENVTMRLRHWNPTRVNLWQMQDEQIASMLVTLANATKELLLNKSNNLRL